MYISISKGALLASLALCAWFGTLHPATSADLGPQPREPLIEPAPPPSQWQFSFTPYGWATSINDSGEVTGFVLLPGQPNVHAFRYEPGRYQLEMIGKGSFVVLGVVPQSLELKKRDAKLGIK